MDIGKGQLLKFPMPGGKVQKKSVDSKNLAQVLDLSRSKEALDRDRRSTQRTLLSELVRAHIVVPGRGLQSCSLYDISQRGLSFDLIHSQGKFKENEKMSMRFYLSHDTYFSFQISIKYVRWQEDEGVYRHGAQISPKQGNRRALAHLVRFIEAVSMNLKKDPGDLLIPSPESN